VLLSSLSANSVLHLASDGTMTTVASLSSPGELVPLPGGSVLLPTGDSTEGAELGLTNGTFVILDPATGAAPTYATGLTGPNGLALDAAGNAYTTDAGMTPGTGITRVLASDPAHPQVDWAPVTDSNGIAIDNAKRLLYVDQTFSATNDVEVLSLDAPQSVSLLVSLTGIGSPVPKGLDDMILDPDGILDVAANPAGEVFRIDPATKYACLLDGNLALTASVGLESGPPHGLLVAGWDGTLNELVPPEPLTDARSRLAPRSLFRLRLH
jgi:DNA-binding beta-propeller fold protein YncE